MLCHMNHVMRKPAFCLCENKGADQLHGNHTFDQCLCFRYIGSAIPSTSVAVRPGLCLTWSETPKTYLCVKRIIYCAILTQLKLHVVVISCISLSSILHERSDIQGKTDINLF